MMPPPPPSPSPSVLPPCVPFSGVKNAAPAQNRNSSARQPSPAPETETSTPLLAQHGKLLAVLLCSAEREEAKHALFKGFVQMFNNRLQSGSGSRLELPNDLASLTTSFENVLRAFQTAIQEAASLPCRTLRVEREAFCQCLAAAPACVEVTEAMRIAAARNNDDDDDPCARQAKIIRALKEGREDILLEVGIADGPNLAARIAGLVNARQKEVELEELKLATVLSMLQSSEARTAASEELTTTAEASRRRLAKAEQALQYDALLTKLDKAASAMEAKSKVPPKELIKRHKEELATFIACWYAFCREICGAQAGPDTHKTLLAYDDRCEAHKVQTGHVESAERQVEARGAIHAVIAAEQSQSGARGGGTTGGGDGGGAGAVDAAVSFVCRDRVSSASFPLYNDETEKYQPPVLRVHSLRHLESMRNKGGLDNHQHVGLFLRSKT